MNPACINLEHADLVFELLLAVLNSFDSLCHLLFPLKLTWDIVGFPFDFLVQREGAVLASDSEKLPTDQVLFISHLIRTIPFFNLNSMHQSNMASCIWISVRFVNASSSSPSHLYGTNHHKLRSCRTN